MKNGKNPTKQQKIILKDAGLNPNEWLVIKNLPGALHLIHRIDGSLLEVSNN